MPGLIDAHTHVGAVDNSFGANFEDNHPGRSTPTPLPASSGKR